MYNIKREAFKMIREDILEKLVCFTDEEIDNLNGKNIIDKSIYEHENSNIIDYHKMLGKDQMITVRKHTRFIEYPKQKHNSANKTPKHLTNKDCLVNSKGVINKLANIINIPIVTVWIIVHIPILCLFIK